MNDILEFVSEDNGGIDRGEETGAYMVRQG